MSMKEWKNINFHGEPFFLIHNYYIKSKWASKLDIVAQLNIPKRFRKDFKAHKKRVCFEVEKEWSGFFNQHPYACNVFFLCSEILFPISIFILWIWLCEKEKIGMQKSWEMLEGSMDVERVRSHTTWRDDVNSERNGKPSSGKRKMAKKSCAGWST